MPAWQATCVAIGGRGLLIEGAPGSGKSSLALALIDRGAQLVGDDSLMLERRGEQLFASPHANTQGLLEVRNLGLLDFPACRDVPVSLAILLDEQTARYPETIETIERFGAQLRLVRLWQHSPVLHLRAELALARFGSG